MEGLTPETISLIILAAILVLVLGEMFLDAVIGWMFGALFSALGLTRNNDAEQEGRPKRRRIALQQKDYQVIGLPVGEGSAARMLASFAERDKAEECANLMRYSSAYQWVEVKCRDATSTESD